MPTDSPARESARHVPIPAPRYRFRCRACEAPNPRGGDCRKCGKPLGSIPAAIVAASVTMAALVAFQGLATLVTGWRLPVLASFYGVFISWAVATRSAGRGVRYQAIATAFTVLAIVLGGMLSLMVLMPMMQMGVGNAAALAWKLIRRYDILIAFFATFGVIGGLWLWMPADGSRGPRD